MAIFSTIDRAPGTRSAPIRALCRRRLVTTTLLADDLSGALLATLLRSQLGLDIPASNQWASSRGNPLLLGRRR